MHINPNASDLVGINSAQFTVLGLAPNADAIQGALADSGIDFSNADFTADDLAAALAQSYDLNFDGDITGFDITIALRSAGISLSGTDIDPADIATALNGVDAPADLPVNGTVYSITNLGNGFANVYVAVPNEDGTAAASIHDTLVTPFGNVDVPTTYDAIAFLDPGNAVAPLADDAGAFTIGGMTFDPGDGGWDSIQPLVGVAPLLNIGGGHMLTPGSASAHDFATQDFAVSGANGDDLGTITTAVNSLNLLGLIQGTQFTVTDVTPGDGVDTTDLPTDGTVYSVTNLGGGFYNIYEAIPNADGTAAGSITDTFVTPFGSFEVPTEFDAVAAMNPGSALDGLSALGAGDVGSDNAFTIDGITFDPGSGGFDSVTPVFGIAPLLQLGGGDAGFFDLANQDLTTYDATGADLGAISTGVQTANILGIENTQFTVTGVSIGESDFTDAITASGVDLGTIDPDALANAFLNSPAMQLAVTNGNVTGSTVFVGAIQGGGINLMAAGVDTNAIADAINSVVDERIADMPMPTGGV